MLIIKLTILTFLPQNTSNKVMQPEMH